MLTALVALQIWSSDRKEHAQEHGATAVEYALMVAFIALGVVVAAKSLGDKTTQVFNKTAASMP